MLLICNMLLKCYIISSLLFYLALIINIHLLFYLFLFFSLSFRFFSLLYYQHLNHPCQLLTSIMFYLLICFNSKLTLEIHHYFEPLQPFKRKLLAKKKKKQPKMPKFYFCPYSGDMKVSENLY